MKAAELCTGYGGLFLAMRQAGWPVELAWYAETDPDAARLLAAHHPGVPNAGDITTAQFTAQEPVDVLACGYPCTPFSVAGKRKGTDDDRWIWPDVARAVRLVRPRIVLLENVPGHLAWGFSRVLADLAALGYVGSWTCVRASDVGAPHRRERLFVVATDADRHPVRPEPVGLGARHHPAVAGDHREGAGGLDLLPTPTSRDADRGRWDGYRNGLPLGETIMRLLPTVGARLGGGRGTPSPATAEQRMADGRRNLDDAVALLPTPVAGDAKGARNATANRVAPLATTNTSAWTLGDVAYADRWGAYSAAIARWETALGRPAPDPTGPGTRGRPRLSARFVEWMQGLPAGHVTDHVTRSAALRLLGNGVVPQQGAHALAHLTATVPAGGPL